MNVRKIHIDFDGVRYPRDGMSTEYGSNDCLDHYKDIKVFHKEYVGEELFNLFLCCSDMKIKYLFQVVDLRFQVDHNIPKENQLFEEDRCATFIARLFLILIRHREIEMISNGKKLLELILVEY